MFSPSLITASTGSFSAEVERLRAAIESANAICVGAGAGLSAAAGFAYDGERFERHFSAWRERYGFADMYSGGFHPYDTLEEYWGFWAKSVLVNRYEFSDIAPQDKNRPEASTDNVATGEARAADELGTWTLAAAGAGAAIGVANAAAPQAAPLYRRLVALLAGHDYFVLTTNVDHQFQLAGIDRERLFYTQGDYGLFQCAEPCHAATYDNEAQVRAMAAAVDEKLARQRAARVPGRLLDLSIPSELVPRCPRCGRPMNMNLRCDDTFVEDEGWHAAHDRYARFLKRHRRSRVLYLELGVGFNTPGIIKYPFWQRTAKNPHATFASVNLGQVVAPAQIASRAILIDANITDVIDACKVGAL